MRTRRWVLTLGLLVGCGSSREDSGGGGATRATPPVTKDYRCFDLPGTPREELRLLPDGKRIAWSERRVDNGQSIYDFVALDLATGTTQVLQKDARHAQLVGDRIVFQRATNRAGKPIYEWKNRLFIGERAITPETDDEDVTGFRVDRATGTIFYTTYRSQQHTLWKVAAAGGAPEKVRDDTSVHHVIDGGKALVVATTGGLARMPIAGGDPSVLVSSGTWGSAVAGDTLVYLPKPVDKAKPPLLHVVPLAGGTPSPLPGARPPSRLLTGGEQTFVIDRTQGNGNRIISRADTMAPIAHLFGIDVESAAMLPDGVTLAALVVHDTNDDGELDYKDEADVCLVPTSSSPKPFTPATRTVPKRLAQAWKSVEALASGDLAGAYMRYVEHDGTLLIKIDVPGDGPATLDDLFARIKAVGATVASAFKEPALGVAITWKQNKRLAAMLWDDTRKTVVPRAGAYGMLVIERASFSLAANPMITQKEDFSQRMPISTVCSGTVTNLGAAPVDVEVECRGWSYDKKMPYDGASLAKRTTVRGVAPGATAKYTVDMGSARMPFHKSSHHFFVGGAEVPWFDEHAWAEVADYIATNDRVRAATGYMPKDPTVVGGPLTLNANHYGPELAASDFNAQTPQRQQEIVKLVWTEYAAHYKKTHGRDKLYDVRLMEGTLLGRSVRNGKLEPNPEYNK